MTKWKKLLLLGTLEIGALLALHALLIRTMADRQIVSTILSAGEHVPRLTLATATLFLTVRFMSVLALPGMILVRIGLVLWEWRSGDKAGQHVLHGRGKSSRQIAAPTNTA